MLYGARFEGFTSVCDGECDSAVRNPERCRLTFSAPSCRATAEGGGASAGHNRKGLRAVAMEASGIAGDVRTFFELEGETNKSCCITPGCAWQLSFVPTVRTRHELHRR